MSKSPSDSKHVTQLFDEFITASTLKSVLTLFRRIYQILDLEPGPFSQFYPILKKGIACSKNWKSQSIFAKIEKKAFNKIYHASSSSSGRSSTGSNCNNILKNHNCLVIGGGPCGLRTAIELQLLGARHVVITEKRDRFSRNNVLHLWPFVIADLKQLAGKKFYGKFCAGSIDHVSIRQLQLMLLKVALIIGCEFLENVTFEEICPHNLVDDRPRRENSSSNTNDSDPDASLTSSLDNNGGSLSTSNSSTQKRKLSVSPIEENGNSDGRCKDLASQSDFTNQHSKQNIGNHNGANKTKELSSRNVPSFCGCCCHLHQGKSGRNFWSNTSKNYIGTFAHFSLTSPPSSTGNMNISNQELILEKLHTYPFDILIGGDGRRNTLNDNFPRKEFRGKLAIAITANFINNHTLAEAQIPEISGISFIYHQEMFKSLHDETGIDLENICYYKDDTHYFVMTAKKSSLLQRGVLISDHSDTRALLAPENIDRQNLMAYARDAAKWTTGLSTPNFALNHYGEADVAMFDFTSMYAADNACRAKQITRVNHQSEPCSRCNCDNEQCKKQRKDMHLFSNYSNRHRSVSPADGLDDLNQGLLLISLVGDSLLEPFWPTGSGCGRGFLSAMDAAWMVRQWAVKKCRSPKDEERILQVLSERESIYRLLAQTTSENLSSNWASHTISPVTRYPNLNTSTLFPHQCKHLLYSNLTPPMEPRFKVMTMAEKRARRATIAITSPFSGEISESRRRVEREFSAINKIKELENKESESTSKVSQDYEDSLAVFEESYKGLMNSMDEPPPSGSSALLSSSVPDYSDQAYYDLSLSPSANNLLTIGKSRARDIECAFRHRRQRQTFLKRSDELDHPTRTHQKAQQHCLNHLRQQLKSKAAWFFDQKSDLTDTNFDSTGKPSEEKRGSFTERIKDLEAKLYAASGITYLSDENSETREEPIRLPSTKSGVKVMMTASQLQQLLNPKYQEEKLRQEAKTKAKKDIKFVGKITKQDWNVKCFEKTPQDKAPPPPLKNSSPPSPPPPQRIELFRNKLNDIQTKLEHIDDHHVPDRRNKESKSNGEYISMLKSELTERTSKGKGELLSKDGKKTQEEVATKRELKSLAPEKIVTSKLCSKCGNIGAPVDKIIINGTLFHRSCLKCIKCGVALRLSEVRNSEKGEMASLLSSNSRDNFNYQCTNCLKNLTNSIKNTKDTISDLLVNRVNKTEDKLEAGKVASQPAALKYKTRLAYTPPPIVKPALDDYEAKIKERIKWKEMFLLTNNNIDLSNVTKIPIEQNNKEEPIKVQESKNLLNERMEFENTNQGDVMVDEEELTKMLNLDSDQWETEGENDSNESDKEESKQKTANEDYNEESSSSVSWDDSDSTDNDFDSDEFDEESSSSDEVISKENPICKIDDCEDTYFSPKKTKPIIESAVIVPENTDNLEMKSESDSVLHTASFPSEKTMLKHSEEDEDVTEKETSIRKSKANNQSSGDSDTINGVSKKQFTAISTPSFEEIEFRKVCDEMEKKSPIFKEKSPATSKGKRRILSGSRKNSPMKQKPEKMIDATDSDDESRTSLSSWSFNASDTYDDIDLSSVWEESANGGVSRTHGKFSGLRGSGRTNAPIIGKEKRSSGLFKSKTDAFITNRMPYLSQDLSPRSKIKNEVDSHNGRHKVNHQSHQKPPLPPSLNLSTNHFVEPMPKGASSHNKPSVIDVKPKTENNSLSSSPPNSNGDKSSPTSESKENYSKIPVLSARVTAANGSAKPSANKSKYLSGYSGSFTEKLLSRCRSSPTIPMIGDSLSRWSTSKMQLSSPIKVLTVTQAMNAQNSSSSPPKTNLTSTKPFTLSKTLTQQHQSNHNCSSSLPFADVNEAE